jgi:hypothetical protein
MNEEFEMWYCKLRLEGIAHLMKIDVAERAWQAATLAQKQKDINIAMTYHHGGTCRISKRCAACQIAKAIEESN